MSAYTNEQYLLDRALAEDASMRLWVLFDLRLPADKAVDMFINECLMPEVYVDFTVIMGGEPSTYTAEGFAKYWASTSERLDGLLHHIGGRIIELPVPDGEVKRPTATKVHRQTYVVLRKGDYMTQGGGTMTIDLQRLEGVKGNPWRISSIVSHKRAFMIGDPRKLAEQN